MSGDDELYRWRMALIDQVGGVEVEAMVDEHYVEGRTLGQIAKARGIAPSTVHKKVQKMRGVFLQYGLLPQRWKRRREKAFP